MKRTFIAIVGLSMLVASGVAAKKLSLVGTKTPPTINTELRLNYWKAEAVLMSLRPKFEEATNAEQTAIKAMQTVCGSDFELQIDPKNSDLVCTVKQIKPVEKK